VTKPRVVILGAGFGGLEAATTLSETLGEAIEIVLIDSGAHFVFGFAKLDVMLGRVQPEEVRNTYDRIRLPGVRFVNTEVTAIDPSERRVTTAEGEFTGDYLVIALGAELDFAATPGLLEHGNEFYSVAGVERLSEVIPSFTGGNVIIGVSGAPFKCPPAPSEAALMFDSHLRNLDVRADSSIKVVLPLPVPIPPSPEASQQILRRFTDRGIDFIPNRRVQALAPGQVLLDDGSTLPFDLYLGVPVHQAPRVVREAGFSAEGWIPVDSRTMATDFPNVYAVGDCASVGTPKAGVFAERQAKAVALNILAEVRGEKPSVQYDGWGTCYIEFGDEGVARVDVHFLDGTPTGELQEPTPELTAEKANFGTNRIARWFSAG